MASGAASDSSSKDSRWYFTVEQLQNSPSKKCGIDNDVELQHRQNAAYLIQGMGERLRVSQLCINTAIVYMHRFYAFHSFTHFHRNGIAAASLFLAAKVEEQPRKLDSVIHTAHVCLNIDMPDPTKESFQEQAQDLVFNENVLLQTLGFDVAVDHPHTHVVKTCHLVKACKDLAQTSYFLASNSLHLTTMCLQYRPTVVACFCIYLACKWSRWEIPQSTEGKYWFHYVDKTVTTDLLEQLTNEFLAIYEKSPARLKTKLNSIKPIGMSKSSDSQKSVGQLSSSELRSQHSSSSEHSRSHSSHHRSNHHHKQPGGENSSSKHMVQIPQKLPQQSTSSSSSSSSGSSSRHRPERGERPSIAPEPHFPALHRTSGNSKNPMHSAISRGESSSSIPPSIPPQRSSSHASLDPNYQIPMSKSRSSMGQQHIQPIAAQQESHRHISKMDQRQHGMKELKSIDPTKSISKSSQPSSGNNIFPSGGSGNVDSQRSSSSSMSRPQYPQQPPNYNQVMANRSLPAEHSSSVHMQKTAPISATATTESSFRLTDDLPRITESMSMNSPPKQQQQQTTKAPSIFSPEWNDKSSAMSATTKTANNATTNNGLSTSVKAKDSPKKHDKRSDTPKKDKRMELPITPVQQKIPTHSEKRSNSAKKLSETPGMPVINVPPPISPFIETNQKSGQQHGSVPTKRGHSDELIKQEDGIDFRESKMRKIDIKSLSPIRSNKPSPYMQSNVPLDNSMKLQNTAAYNAMNGIETNPDLVSSLLKESLCNESKFIPFNQNVAANPINNPPHQQQPPQQLLQLPQQQLQMSQSFPPQQQINSTHQMPSQIQIQQQQNIALHQQPTPSTMLQSMKLEPKSETLDSAYESQPMDCIAPIVDSLPAQIKIEQSSSDDVRIKSEKKKKKDKHKHKEKDKSKDKEERKKHKKDKDRHRDKDSSREKPATDIHNPIKITIPKDKLNLPSLESNQPPTSGFKITIPKDRIKTDVPPPPPPTSLKIKISKDMIESYNPNVDRHHGGGGGGIADGHGGNSSHVGGSGGGGGGGHSSSKKKDRDKDRDRDKSKSARNSLDYNKHNGSGGNNSNGSSNPNSGNNGNASGSSNRNSSHPNKMVSQYNSHPHSHHQQQIQKQQQQQQYHHHNMMPSQLQHHRHSQYTMQSSNQYNNSIINNTAENNIQQNISLHSLPLLQQQQQQQQLGTETTGLLSRPISNNRKYHQSIGNSKY